MTPTEAYPLQWPVGWTRTHPAKRRDAPYRVSFTRARDALMRSLALFGASDIVLSSNIALRRDGLPYAHRGEPSDPGIAVYWTHRGAPRVIACDCWDNTRDNLRAVGLAVDALRALERGGASQILERAFVGFTALPADAGADGRPHWRDVFHVDPSAAITRAELVALYRELARLAHPDHGGSTERMAELNAARVEALRELGQE